MKRNIRAEVQSILDATTIETKITKRVLIGANAYLFYKKLEKYNWNSQKIDNDVLGGIIDETTPNKIIYTAFSCCGNETFVEDFDNIVEAAKYASGIMATTIDGTKI